MKMSFISEYQFTKFNQGKTLFNKSQKSHKNPISLDSNPSDKKNLFYNCPKPSKLTSMYKISSSKIQNMIISKKLPNKSKYTKNNMQSLLSQTKSYSQNNGSLLRGDARKGNQSENLGFPSKLKDKKFNHSMNRIKKSNDSLSFCNNFRSHRKNLSFNYKHNDRYNEKYPSKGKYRQKINFISICSIKDITDSKNISKYESLNSNRFSCRTSGNSTKKDTIKPKSINKEKSSREKSNNNK